MPPFIGPGGQPPTPLWLRKLKLGQLYVVYRQVFPVRVSQVVTEVATLPDTQKGRVSQISAEIATSPTYQKARVSQFSVEVATQNLSAKARFSQVAVEIAIRNLARERVWITVSDPTTPNG